MDQNINMDSSSGKGKAWLWILIILIIVLAWWALSSSKTQAPATNLEEDNSTVEITVNNADEVVEDIDSLEGLDDASLDAEFNEIDAELETL